MIWAVNVTIFHGERARGRAPCPLSRQPFSTMLFGGGGACDGTKGEGRVEGSILGGYASCSVPPSPVAGAARSRLSSALGSQEGDFLL